MSRPLRIDYPNAWHHVMNRARRGEDLFVDKADYQQFIDLLGSEKLISRIKDRFFKKKIDKDSKFKDRRRASANCFMRYNG